MSLFTPLTIGDLVLENRVVMAPLTRGRTGLSKNNRTPTDINAEYYKQRATAGLIISEATAISDQGFGWYGAPALYTEDHASGWKKVVDGVHEKGSKIFLQLWHMGRQAHSSLHEKKEIVSASAIAKKGEIRDINWVHQPYETPRALTIEEIQQVVKDYVHSATLAKKAGFDGVELHGANGYLIDQFLQSVSNKRTDEYGGSIENRSRLLFQVIEGLLTVFPANRVGIRISPNGVFGDMGSEDNFELFTYVAKKLDTYKIGYIHIMDGLGFGFHKKSEPVRLIDIKRVFSGVVMGNIGYTKETAEGALRTGAVDLIAFGRLYLSNPDLVERFKNNYPLAEAEQSTWYGNNTDQDGSTGKGYTDFPNYQPPATNSN